MLQRLERAARAAGRDPAAIRVVAVTKAVGADVARELFDLGMDDLGESRADELERKAVHFEANPSPRGRPRWHFVGHLQQNKARRVVRRADWIHSVDSLKLLETLARLSREEGRATRVFLQVKLSNEPQKSGLAPEDLRGALSRARELGLAVEGLMTLAPLEAGPALGAQREGARAVFEGLSRLAQGLPRDAFRSGRPLLSMGMSDDFEEAIRAGADLVRVGGAFFGGLP